MGQGCIESVVWTGLGGDFRMIVWWFYAVFMGIWWDVLRLSLDLWIQRDNHTSIFTYVVATNPAAVVVQVGSLLFIISTLCGWALPHFWWPNDNQSLWFWGEHADYPKIMGISWEYHGHIMGISESSLGTAVYPTHPHPKSAFHVWWGRREPLFLGDSGGFDMWKDVLRFQVRFPYSNTVLGCFTILLGDLVPRFPRDLQPVLFRSMCCFMLLLSPSCAHVTDWFDVIVLLISFKPLSSRLNRWCFATWFSGEFTMDIHRWSSHQNLLGSQSSHRSSLVPRIRAWHRLLVQQ